MMKVVWITGASSGLGYSTAKALVRAGYTVVCGARSFEGQEGESETGYRLPLDVRDEKSCDAFCCRAREKFGAPWALVNAAGVLTLGACEQYAARELKDVLDTNFLGGVRMTQRVLADMRAQGAGRIVNFSSINGLLGIPFQGAYVASKHAIEGFSECLAAEVAPFGVQVMLVEPGDHQGGSQRCRRHAAAQEADGSPYAATYASTIAAIAHDEANGLNPDRLGEKVVRALGRKHMPMRLRVASLSQHFATVVHDVLPFRLFMHILVSYYYKGVKKEPAQRAGSTR